MVVILKRNIMWSHSFFYCAGFFFRFQSISSIRSLQCSPPPPPQPYFTPSLEEMSGIHRPALTVKSSNHAISSVGRTALQLFPRISYFFFSFFYIFFKGSSALWLMRAATLHHQGVELEAEDRIITRRQLPDCPRLAWTDNVQYFEGRPRWSKSKS